MSVLTSRIPLAHPICWKRRPVAASDRVAGASRLARPIGFVFLLAGLVVAVFFLTAFAMGVGLIAPTWVCCLACAMLVTVGRALRGAW